MKETLLTCPFTGVPFKALKDLDGNLYFTHPLTGESVRIGFNHASMRYIVPSRLFKQIETVTFPEAAEILQVSRQRVSAIAAANVIRPVLVNGEQRFVLSEVLKYKERRKTGAPKKG